jgi:hypothetical protein
MRRKGALLKNELLSALAAAIACLCCPVNVYAMASTGPGGSNAQAVQALGEWGAGIQIGIIGGQNVYFPHQAFDGNNIHNLAVPGLTTDPNWHDTMLAGVIISHGGGAYPNNVGVAPDANIYSIRIYYDTHTAAALKTLIETNNCRIIVSGLQWPFVADGNSFQTMLYDYYAYQYNVIFANAAGNSDTGITHVSVFGDAYNGITTGGLVLADSGDPSSYRKVGSNSLSGPTADGRRKPEIVAPSAAQIVPSSGSFSSWRNTDSVGGTGGATSWAVPHTAGTAALLLGLADSLSDPDRGNNLVIKAVIVNSAFPNIKAKDSSATTGEIFDPDRGYGRIDALRAYQTLNAGRISKGTISNSAKGWAFDTISLGSPHTYQIVVPKYSRLLVTLTWDRRLQWTDNPPKNHIIDSGELTAYNANLDLEIYEPNGSTPIFSESHDGLSPRDNLEKCDLLAAMNGTYQVKVVNKTASETRDYGLAFEITPPIAGDIAQPLDYIVDYKDLSVFADQWLLDGTGLAADLALPANHIDFSDFAVFAQNWLATNNAYYAGY